MQIEIEDRLVIRRVIETSYIAVVLGSRHAVKKERDGLVELGRILVGNLRARYQFEGAGEPDDRGVVVVSQVLCERVPDSKHGLIISHLVLLVPSGAMKLLTPANYQSLRRAFFAWLLR